MLGYSGRTQQQQCFLRHTACLNLTTAASLLAHMNCLITLLTYTHTHEQSTGWLPRRARARSVRC